MEVRLVEGGGGVTREGGGGARPLALASVILCERKASKVFVFQSHLSSTSDGTACAALRRSRSSALACSSQPLVWSNLRYARGWRFKCLLTRLIRSARQACGYESSQVMQISPKAGFTSGQNG